MVGTIVPRVFGANGKNCYRSPLWFHMLGSLLGGIAIGCLLVPIAMLVIGSGVLGILRRDLAMSIVCLLTGLRELRLLKIPLPQLRKQVPHRWRFFQPDLMAFLYGCGLGCGVLTRIPITTFHAILISSVLSGERFMPIVVMGLYGISRSLPVLWFGITTSKVSVKHIDGTLRTVMTWQYAVPGFNGIVLVLIGAILLAAH